ncbi:transmembrane protein 68-like isoform X5 [Hirundo rustica]|uniref:transmembrane protein 68-like isoform X5 n=1 Tax=Hirundo rustica TaxID=43150 RepID=UPI001A951EBF|nr:transmembrane protein 68-like isoform X5 [Hirundo rustica]
MFRVTGCHARGMNWGKLAGRGQSQLWDGLGISQWLDMIGRKESCASGQIPMTNLSSLFYALEEWTVVEFLKKYLFLVIIGSLTISGILVFFIVPLTIVFFIYLSNILLLIYQRNNELKADPLSDVWNSVRKTIASFWDIYARIWHGYELHGVENLPEGPGILVYYHGAIPIDYLYFLSRLFLWKKRLCLSVADHFVFRLPGLKLLLAVTGVIPGTREECLVALKNGYLVSISPGGVREALFSDESYQLMWGNRKGFAQVALEAKVTKTAVQALISKHQTIPGNIWKALLERFDKRRKSD